LGVTFGQLFALGFSQLGILIGPRLRGVLGQSTAVAACAGPAQERCS
jgi:hypothetical protein